MQQMNRKVSDTKAARNAAIEPELKATSGASIVLPKFARRTIRYFNRLMDGGFSLTPRSMMVVGGLFVLAIVGGGLTLTGTQYGADAARTFNILSVKHYDISGNKEVADVKIVKMLAPRNGESLFGYDVKKARDILKENPWVFDATVAKVYPNKLAVHVEERSAFGILQQGEAISLIDQNGEFLANYDGRPELPLFVGKGANEAASALLDQLNRYPEVATRVKAHVRVGARRWNLQMDNGVDVMLPEKSFEHEIQRLAHLIDEQDILSKDIERIDLRQPDRMVLKLTKNAADLREKNLSDTEEALKASINRRHL